MGVYFNVRVMIGLIICFDQKVVYSVNQDMVCCKLRFFTYNNSIYIVLFLKAAQAQSVCVCGQ